MCQLTLHSDPSVLEPGREKARNELRASIVIPFHDDCDLLERTVASLTQQCYPKDLFEVVIVSDANHFLARHIVDVYKKEISIKFLNLFNGELCLSSSRNAGIKVAKGDVIVSLDSDMICPPTFLESHMKWFHRHSKIATIGLRKFVRADGIKPEEIIHCFKQIASLPEIRSVSNTCGSLRDKRIKELQYWSVHPFPSNCFHGGNVAYWRDDAFDVGLWDEEFNGNYGYEDIEFGQRLHEHNTKLIFENGATTYHQENNSLPVSKRRYGLTVNRVKLYQRFPALGKFRREILAVR